jgi:hypothetical protein
MSGLSIQIGAGGAERNEEAGVITEMVAHVVGFAEEEELGCFTAGFSEFDTDAGFSLLFQAQADAHAPDQQDIELGMDTYCIVTGDQSQVHYGGLQHAKLAGKELQLIFKPGIGHKFGVADKLRVRLEVSECALQEFKEGFRQVVSVPWGRATEKPTLSGF